MKCKECDKEAKWLVIDFDAFDELFTPLCEEHFQQILQMEGEVNLDFDLIDNLTIEEVMSMANEKWKYLSHKYSNLLKLYSKKENETK
jgi:hypothetical protein